MKRRWGASPAAELILPSGAALADDAAVYERLIGILPARPGTVSLVLMTGQAQLSATVALLKTRAKDAVSDLADILRRAVLETGGVAVDSFMERLAEREQKAIAQMKEAGTVINEVSPEAKKGFQAAVKPVWDKYGKSLEAIVQRIQDVK